MNIPTYLSGVIQVKAFRILQAYIQATLERFGLNPTQWSILGQIYEHEGELRLGDIARELQVEAPLITMLAEPLVEQGLVEKVTHQKDKRAKLLVLTPKGQRAVENIEKTLRNSLNELLAGISKNDLEAYRRVLEAIIKNGSTMEQL